MNDFKSYKDNVVSLLEDDSTVKNFTNKISDLYNNLSASGKSVTGYNGDQLKYHIDQVEKFDERFGIKKIENKLIDLFSIDDVLEKTSIVGSLNYYEVINYPKSLDWFNSFLNEIENSLSNNEVNFADIENVKLGIKKELSKAKLLFEETL